MKIETCEFPEALLYDVDSGTWARREGDDYRIGITPVFGWISGGFTKLSAKGIGTHVEAGKGLGSVEGPKHFDLVRAPFDCIIKEVNIKLASNPKLANKDPYGSGWFAVIGQTGAESRLRTLPEATESIAATIRRLKVRCLSEFPDIEMYEIGTECSAVLVRLNEQFAKSESGTVAHLVSDDPTASIELTRWEKLTGNRVLESRDEGNIHHFLVRKK